MFLRNFWISVRRRHLPWLNERPFTCLSPTADTQTPLKIRHNADFFLFLMLNHITANPLKNLRAPLICSLRRLRIFGMDAPLRSIWVDLPNVALTEDDWGVVAALGHLRKGSSLELCAPGWGFPGWECPCGQWELRVGGPPGGGGSRGSGAGHPFSYYKPSLCLYHLV